MTRNEDKDIHPFNEAGRRVLAALVSYQLGLKGVDYTLKTTPEVVDSSWAFVAEHLLRGLMEGAWSNSGMDDVLAKKKPI